MNRYLRSLEISVAKRHRGASHPSNGSKSKKAKAFTLIELLIVIAIILILIAIALPNFLAAQARAKVVRERADIRSIATAIESLRIDYDFLLVDFWDDDDDRILRARFRGGLNTDEPPRFAPCCATHGTNRRGGTSGVFAPLTTPIPYLTSIPNDPFVWERGDLALIDDDVIPPVTYMYHDRESKDLKLMANNPSRDFLGVMGCYVAGACLPGTHGIEKPLSMDHYLLIGMGPDSERNDDLPTPYAPTNGTASFGDVIYRSDGGV